MRAFEILNEMIIRSGTPEDGTTVLAFQGNIWMFDPWADDIPKRNAKILKDINKHTGLQCRSMEEIVNSCDEDRPDILVGSIARDRNLYISTRGFPHATSSPTLKKVLSALSLRGVTYNQLGGDDYEYEDDVDKVDFVGRIPDVVYHGTCTKYIRSILKRGLMSTNNTNWEDFKFAGRIFLTTDLNRANFHANRQADNLGCVPVVIATRIPDRSRIVLDYDVAYGFYGVTSATKNAGYAKHIEIHSNPSDRLMAKKIQKHNPKTDFTKTTGIFAYQGRIPPTFFQRFYTTFNAEQTLGKDIPFEFDSVARFLDALNMYEEYDFYDPDYVPEEDEENNWNDDTG